MERISFVMNAGTGQEPGRDPDCLIRGSDHGQQDLLTLVSYLLARNFNKFAERVGIIHRAKKPFSHTSCKKTTLFHHSILQVNKDASFYLCGPAGNMPAQMKEAAINAIAKAGNMPKEQAEQMVTDWQIKGKYNVEVW